MPTLIPRRLMFPILFAFVLVLGILFVFWMARNLGLGNIGQFYGQADELLEDPDSEMDLNLDRDPD